jgi:four helix bundle protein
MMNARNARNAKECQECQRMPGMPNNARNAKQCQECQTMPGMPKNARNDECQVLNTVIHCSGLRGWKMEERCGEHPEQSEGKQNRQYDLAERTTRFAESIVIFARKLPRTPVTMSIISQLVRAATSVGANNREADDSVSRKDFRNKIGYCRKEANETKYWLQMIAAAVPEMKEDARQLWREADELHKIFRACFRTASTQRPESNDSDD